MCIRAQYSGHKLLPLPLGPKWQWHSRAFDGEDKSETKAHIIGASSPLFLGAHKKKVLYVAMTVESTDNPAYRPNKNLRRSFISHLTASKWIENATGEDYFSILHQGSTNHANYMRTVADSMFVLSPPGMVSCVNTFLKKAQALIFGRRIHISCRQWFGYSSHMGSIGYGVDSDRHDVSFRYTL